MNSNYAILFYMTECELMCWNIGSTVGIQISNHKNFPYVNNWIYIVLCHSIYRHIISCCEMLFHISTNISMLICRNIVSYFYIWAKILQYSMLTFDFIRWNVDSYVKIWILILQHWWISRIWVQKLAPYKNWTNHSLYLIPLQVKNHRTKVISKIAFGRNVCN